MDDQHHAYPNPGLHQQERHLKEQATTTVAKETAGTLTTHCSRSLPG